jgi:tetratricopeptide (TPR) repeat protein
MPRAARPVCVFLLLSLFALSSCSEPEPRSNLPPSASDLVLLRTVKLCDPKTKVLQASQGASLQRQPWGSGEELRTTAEALGSEASYLFDQDDTMVGAVFAFPRGHSLKPYPVLRRTLEQLKPSLEFYLNVAAVPDRANLDPTALYETGDATSTTAYLVLAADSAPTLLMATFAIDPYAKLLSPYRREFLKRVQSGDRKGSGGPAQGPGAQDKEPFLAVQQFARGEAAHFASCGPRDDRRAAEAYTRAIAQGLSNKVWLAEAHHRLGLALEGTGRLEEAKAALKESLTIRPSVAEVFNTLGTVHAKLGERDKAIETFERAVLLKPNYSMARFNLAQAYESVNAKRAISEYETYLALAEGIEEEDSRMVLARQRIAALKR